MPTLTNATAGSASAGPGASVARPVIRERREYVSLSRQDRHIVTLLRDAIEVGLMQHSTAGGRALDVGCGAQPFRAGIESLGMTYTGLDATAQPGVSTDFLCSIDQPLPEALAASGGFDLVLCTEVLEHVADWAGAWDNLARLLRPGGKLLLTCPFIYPLHEEPYDFYRPTHHALRHWAERTGLRVLELRPLGDAWDVLGTVIAASGPKPASRWPHAWLLATVAQKFRQLACWIIYKGWPRRFVRVRQTMYLANYAVLAKPQSTGTRGGER